MPPDESGSNEAYSLKMTVPLMVLLTANLTYVKKPSSPIIIDQNVSERVF